MSFTIEKSDSHVFHGTPSKNYMPTPKKSKSRSAKDENAMDIDLSFEKSSGEKPFAFRDPFPDISQHHLSVPGGGTNRRKQPGSPRRKRKMRRLANYATPRKMQTCKTPSKSPRQVKTPSPRAAAYMMRKMIARANKAGSPRIARHKENLKTALNHMLYGFDLGNLKNLNKVHQQVQLRMDQLYAQEFTQTRESLEMRVETDSESVEKMLTGGSKKLPSRAPKVNNNIFNFAGVTKDQLEPEDSPHHASDTLKLFNQLQEQDRDFALELIRTTRLTKFKLPDYKELTAHDEQNREYNFEMQFSFGFDYVSNCRLLARAFDIRKRNFPNEEHMPLDCSNVIAKMLGSNQFEVILKVYFDKTKAKANDWHEQDGEAWLYHPEVNTGNRRDLVNFDREARIYYVENWPTTGMLCEDDYQGQFPAIPPEEVTDKLERIMITWVCSQITWLAFNKVRNLSSKMATKRLSKLLFVLKGWYTGLLLGESFDPVKLDDIENWGVDNNSLNP